MVAFRVYPPHDAFFCDMQAGGMCSMKWVAYKHWGTQPKAWYADAACGVEMALGVVSGPLL
jgi:hypothetical protein